VEADGCRLELPLQIPTNAMAVVRVLWQSNDGN